MSGERPGHRPADPHVPGSLGGLCGAGGFSEGFRQAGFRTAYWSGGWAL